MDKTTGMVIVGAIGLMLLSLTLVDQPQWATEWLSPEIVKAVERVGAAVKSEIGTQPEIIPPAKMLPGGPGNRSPGPAQSRGNPLGSPSE